MGGVRDFSLDFGNLNKAESVEKSHCEGDSDSEPEKLEKLRESARELLLGRSGEMKKMGNPEPIEENIYLRGITGTQELSHEAEELTTEENKCDLPPADGNSGNGFTKPKMHLEFGYRFFG